MLGFCDRAETVRKGLPAFWHLNALGISPIRVSYLFPLSLHGLKVLVAIYQPRGGDSFKLIFRGREGLPSFDLTMEVAGFLVSKGEDSSLSETEHTSGVADEGWALLDNPIDTDVVVNFPGTYDVFLSTPDGEQYVTAVSFLHAQVAPYTPEEITAIKSDPLASKWVRMTVNCKFCGQGVKAYAGIERSPSLESQGFTLNSEIKEDQFTCSCGKTRFSLVPMRTGLHGLLRRNLSPQMDTNVSPVRLYEKTTLEESCRQLLKLIRAKTNEEELQQFLRDHPIFFHVFMPKRVFIKPPILRKYVADFAVLNTRDELLLIEIEKPHLRLLKKDGDTTADLNHAFYQVRTWTQVLDDHRGAALDAIGLKLEEVARVRGVVVAGRKPSDDKKLRLLRSASTAEIELFTYDDLLETVTELVKHVASI